MTKSDFFRGFFAALRLSSKSSDRGLCIKGMEHQRRFAAVALQISEWRKTGVPVDWPSFIYVGNICNDWEAALPTHSTDADYVEFPFTMNVARSLSASYGTLDEAGFRELAVIYFQDLPEAEPVPRYIVIVGSNTLICNDIIDALDACNSAGSAFNTPRVFAVGRELLVVQKDVEVPQPPKIEKRWSLDGTLK